MSRNDEGRPAKGRPTGGHHTAAILARQRLGAEHRRLAIARLAEQAMPLTVYYRKSKYGPYCTLVERRAS
jgi:hypothetical protein